MEPSLELWDIANGQTIRTFTGHTKGVCSVALTPDSRYGLSGGYDRTLKLWNVPRGDALRTMTGHTAEILSVRVDLKMAVSVFQGPRPATTQSGFVELSSGPANSKIVNRNIRVILFGL